MNCVIELKCPICGSTIIDKSDYVDYTFFNCSCDQCFFYIRSCDRTNPKDRVTQQELDDFVKVLELNGILDKEEVKEVQKGISVNTENNIKDLFPRKVLTQQVVELAFFSLLLQKGKTTTLEVKEKLREMNYEATQQQVSDYVSTIDETIQYATDNYTYEDVRKDVADNEARMITLLCSLNIKNVLKFNHPFKGYNTYFVELTDGAFVKTEEELKRERIEKIKNSLREKFLFENIKEVLVAVEELQPIHCCIEDIKESYIKEFPDENPVDSFTEDDTFKFYNI